MKKLFSTFLLIALIGLWFTAVSHHSPSSLAAVEDTVVSANAAFFSDSGQMLGGATGNGVALGDLNGNGYLDALVANDHTAFGEANQVWFNDGAGHFSAGPTLGDFDGYAVALGDLDGDGDLDAVVAGSEGAVVWINQGGAQGGQEGAFLPGDILGAAGFDVAIGDVDNDGHLDLLIVGNSNQVWLNNGNGAFTGSFTFPSQFSRSVLLADLDGDGWLDAVIADSASGSDTQVWWNDGNWDPGPGTFSPGPLLPLPNLVNAVAAADLDGDGLVDLFLAGSGPNQIFWNEGERLFSAMGPLPLNDNSSAVALADVDGDGLIDAVVGNTHAHPNHAWRNEGGRVFTMVQAFGHESGISWGRGLALGDLTGDGSPDLFEATTAYDRVWFNQAGQDLLVYELVRDLILMSTGAGQHYIALFYANQSEIRALLDAHPDLDAAGEATLQLWQSNLWALALGDGNDAIITAEQTTAMDDFLTQLAAVASPDLQQAIFEERSQLGLLEDYVGMTMTEARGVVVGYSLKLPLIRQD